MSEAEKEFKVDITAAIFWASVLAFVGTCYVSVFYESDAVAPPVFAFEVFTVIYIFRVYLGLLMVTYDQSMSDQMRAASSKQRRNYHVVVLALFCVCLFTGFLFRVLGDNAAPIIVMMCSACYAFWWVTLWNIIFGPNNHEKRYDILSLFLDIFSFLFAFAFLFRGTITSYLPQEEGIASLQLTVAFFGAAGFFLLFLAAEFFGQYVPACKRFAVDTKKIFLEENHK